MDTIEGLPFTPTGVSVIGALLFIIAYLFRLNAIDRRDAATRLSTLDAESGERLRKEAEARTADREWLTGFYERRLEKVTIRYEEEVAGLRTELEEVRRRLTAVGLVVEDERSKRHQAEERLAGVQSQLAALQRPRRAGS